MGIGKSLQEMEIQEVLLLSLWGDVRMIVSSDFSSSFSPSASLIVHHTHQVITIWRWGSLSYSASFSPSALKI